MIIPAMDKAGAGLISETGTGEQADSTVINITSKNRPDKIFTRLPTGRFPGRAIRNPGDSLLSVPLFPCQAHY
jgi:hypothetical protein